MRLLDARALIHEGVSRLVDDAEVGKPHFAILSHTWGREEVLFEDIALGPNHEVDSLTKEQRATCGYRSDSRMDDPCAGFKLFKLPEEDRSLRGVCKSCRPRNQSIIRQQRSHIKAGWKKIWSVCLQACRDGYDYVWIDTCCIDKSSNTELAEALNSMFEWYAISDMCYVLLEDCRLCTHRVKAQRSIFESRFIDKCTEAQTSRCRWMSRGWTLQELIAPFRIKFFDQDWTIIGSRNEIAGILSDITGIAKSVFGGQFWTTPANRNAMISLKLQNFSVATKMSWAANRQTTRVEDRAYSLLGLFGVKMPLLYGEGNKAFLRLQEEIIRYSNDDSILAWEFMDDIEHKLYENELLAPSPDYFSWWSPSRRDDLSLYSSEIDSEKVSLLESLEITQKALNTTVPLFHWRKGYGSNAETTRCKKNRSTYEIHSERTLQRSGLGEGNAKEAALVKMVEASEGSSASRKCPRGNSNKPDSSEGIPSEEFSSDEDSFRGRPSEDHASESEFSVDFKKSHALLKCHLGWHPNISFIRIALRLSHTYLRDRHVISQVVSGRPGSNELSKDIRHRMNLRLDKRHRLALYLGHPEKTTTDIGTQSITIRRNSDRNNVEALASKNAIG